MTIVANAKAVDKIRECEPFTNHGGTFTGRYVGTDYVVYSYATEIARYDGVMWTVVARKYSVTTSRHQNIVLRAVN